MNTHKITVKISISEIGFDTEKGSAAFYDFEDKLMTHFEKDGGEYDGNDMGEGEITLYFYGEDLTRLGKRIETFLQTSYLPPHSWKITKEKKESKIRQILPYSEGDWFVVSFPKGGYILGVVTRIDKKHEILLSYFFLPKYEEVPNLENARNLNSYDAFFIYKHHDLGLLDGTWCILGKLPNWDRILWPIPEFVSYDPINGKPKKRVYKEDDLFYWKEEKAISNDEAAKLPKDGIGSSQFIRGKLEVLLSKLHSG